VESRQLGSVATMQFNINDVAGVGDNVYVADDAVQCGGGRC